VSEPSEMKLNLVD